jgi:Ca-activated chloride channel family protein
MSPAQKWNYLISVVALVALLSIAGAAAQTQSNQQPQSVAPQSVTPQTETPKPTASPVRLSVIVADEKKRVVDDVRQDDFRVSEDGVQQTITLFTQEKLPLSYGLVVDNSGTMRTQLPWIIETCATIIRSNEPGDETLIVRFVGNENIEVVQEFTSDKRLLSRALENLYVEGGATALIDALYLSASRLTQHRKDETGRRRALILISDGEDRDSFYKKDELFDMLRKADVQIFVIGLTKEIENNAGSRAKVKAMDFLERLARETGGRVFYVEKASAFLPAIEEIVRSLRTQFVVGYTPTNGVQDGSYRKVQVSIADVPGRDKRQTITRAGYTAPGGKVKEDKKRK